MQWISSLAIEPDYEDAVTALVVDVQRQLGGTQPDLVIAFGTPSYGPGLDDLGATLRELLGGPTVIGCTGGGVIGGGHEIEGAPGLSVMAAVLPKVALRTFHIPPGITPQGGAAWRRLVGVAPADDPAFVMFADPFAWDGAALLGGLDQQFPGAPKVGGVASGGDVPGTNRLWLDGVTYDTGTVGLALTGDIVIDPVVAQGCRPIGDPMFTTHADRNVLWSLDGEAAVDTLERVFDALTPEDQACARVGIFLGVGMEPGEQRYGQGDFLIRHIAGMDPEHGTLHIGALLQAGSVVQFHVRDASSSTADLRDQIARYRAHYPGLGDPAGVLLFSCLGRGEQLYGEPNHDSGLIREGLSPIPIGGFFCNGEIGPVHGRTHLHGYTSALGIVRRRWGH